MQGLNVEGLAEKSTCVLDVEKGKVEQVNYVENEVGP